VWVRPAQDALCFRGTRFSDTAAVEDRFQSTVSGVDGQFRFEGLPACALDVIAEPRGEPRLLARLAEGAAGERRRIELRLTEGVRVRGVVLTQERTAAVHARVSARVARVAGGESKHGSAAFVTAMTDGQGRFELPALGEGEIWLAVEGRQHGIATAELGVLSAGEAREVHLTLGSPAHISGTLRFPDGQPAAGVLMEGVSLRQGVGFGFSASALSGDDGRFSLGPLPAGTVSIRPGWTWHRSGPSNDQLVGPQTVTLAAGEHRTDAAFVVPRRSAQILGTVTDAQGGAVTGASVDLYLEDGHGRAIDFVQRAFTDESGAYAFSHLSPATHRIFAHHPEFGQSHSRRVSPDSRRVTLLLPPSSGR
jgi:hypothetical protein